MVVALGARPVALGATGVGLAARAVAAVGISAITVFGSVSRPPALRRPISNPSAMISNPAATIAGNIQERRGVGLEGGALSGVAVAGIVAAWVGAFGRLATVGALWRAVRFFSVPASALANAPAMA